MLVPTNLRQLLQAHVAPCATGNKKEALNNRALMIQLNIISTLSLEILFKYAKSFMLQQPKETVQPIVHVIFTMFYIYSSKIDILPLVQCLVLKHKLSRK